MRKIQENNFNTLNEREVKNIQNSKIDFLTPRNIKSLKEESVQQYLKNAIKSKSLNDIYADINKAKAPKIKEFTIKDICESYVCEQNTNTYGPTKQQVKEMFKEYIHSNRFLRSKGYMWLADNFELINNTLFNLKDQTAYELSTQLYKRQNKVVSGKQLKKFYGHIGIFIKLGNREKATYRCGAYYRNKLNKIERYSKGAN